MFSTEQQKVCMIFKKQPEVLLHSITGEEESTYVNEFRYLGDTLDMTLFFNQYLGSKLHVHNYNIVCHNLNINIVHNLLAPKACVVNNRATTALKFSPSSVKLTIV